MSDDGVEMASGSEAQALDRIAQSVGARYPQASAELIAQRIQVAYQRYGAAPIRDFVPLLVERELTAELRADTADHE